MSYLQSLQKKVEKNKGGNYTTSTTGGHIPRVLSEFQVSKYGPGPSEEEMAELDKKWNSMPASKRKKLEKLLKARLEEESSEKTESEARDESTEQNRSIHQAKLREQYKKDKEWQDKKDQTALQNQQKEAEAARDAEITRRNAEIKRKQDIKLDAGQVAVDVRRSNQEITVLQREVDKLNTRLVDAGNQKNATVTRWKQERNDKLEEIAILRMEMDNKLVDLVDAATDKYGLKEGIEFLTQMGIDKKKINEILNRK